MIEVVRNELKNWYSSHKRTLPWRSNPKPYLVWLSEVILQQTRVEQGLSYFEKFAKNYPTIIDLADAPEDDILKLWQGLGYYRRARNLHFAAKQVKNEFQGKFPDNYNDILKLKGVGSYTAAAIASIAFNEAKAVVDGNVIRVISRLFQIEDPIDKSETLNQITLLADELLDKVNPSDHNQAMMDFGAMQCVPKKPNCNACPLQHHCSSFMNGKVDQIPLKEKKVKRRSRFFHYIIPMFDKNTLIQQRSENDIWGGLFEFPLAENDSSEILSPSELEELFGVSIKSIAKINSEKKHILSHQDIYATFYHIELKNFKNSKLKLVTSDELHTFALPRLIDRYLENHDLITGKTRH